MPNFSTLLPWYLAVLLATLLSSGCASLPTNVKRPVSAALEAPNATAMGQWVQMRKMAARARSDSAFFLLESEALALSARVALVDGARKTLDLQYYAIHADASTEILLDRLRSAAQRGVRVRLLLDDLNTVGRDAQVLRLAFEPNVQIRLFNPLPGNRATLLGRLLGALPDISRLQKRMHNKLFLADNALGIIGGRNLGDAYFGQGKISNFVDIDVLSVGRIVRDMSISFDNYWNSDLAYPVESLVTGAELEALRQPPTGTPGDQSGAVVKVLPEPATEAAEESTVKSAQSGAPALTPAPSVTPLTHSTVLPDVTASFMLESLMNLKQLPLTWAPSVLLADKPGKIALEEGTDTVTERDDGATVIDGMLTLMERAQREVLIVSPYFVPGQKMMARFAALRARGVKVRVLTNSLASNDAPAAHAGYARYRAALLAMGVELYEMHADQQRKLGGLGSAGGLRPLGSGAGNAGSLASLHSKAVVVDASMLAIGSMNLDLRSRLQNTEVALVVRSRSLAKKVVTLVDATLAAGAYRVTQENNQLVWRAPPGAEFADTTTEPDASIGLRLLVDLIGPFAPDEML